MTQPKQAELDGAALIDITMGGPFEERSYSDDKGRQIRRRMLLAGGAAVWIGCGHLQPQDAAGNPAGPPVFFWYRIPCATNAAEAFEETDRHFEAALPAFVKMAQKKAQENARRILVPSGAAPIRPGGNGGRPN